MATAVEHLRSNVAELFDVTVEEEDIKSFPFFSVVLNDLCDYAKSDKVKKSCLEAEQAKQDFYSQQNLFFQLSIFASAIFEVIDHNNGDKFGFQVSCLCNPKNLKASVSAAEYLNMGLTNTSLPNEDDPNGLRHLGLTKEFFFQHFKPLDKKFISTVLIPEVTNVIRGCSRSVLTFHKQESNEKLVFAKISQLPDLVKKEIDDVMVNRQDIEKNKKLLNRQIESYFECLVTALLLLKEKTQLMENEKDFCSTFTSFFSVKCEALYLKTKILQLQIMNDTYNKETVIPLKIIREQTIEKEKNIEQELMEKTTLLESYEAIGKSFQNLVREFSELSVQIKNEQWALSVLNKERCQ